MMYLIYFTPPPSALDNFLPHFRDLTDLLGQLLKCLTEFWWMEDNEWEIESDEVACEAG